MPARSAPQAALRYLMHVNLLQVLLSLLKYFRSKGSYGEHVAKT